MGKVHLVGAGPGDPELLTVKAVRLLAAADVVLYDGLVSHDILALIRPEATKIDIGKRCGQKLLSQEEINALLVEYSKRFDRVVRLKGGDPSVFGRAGEEIAALSDAGIEFEIVPGITTALAAAAAAKISLTDRRFASSVTLLTAHKGTGLGAVEWNRIVTSGSTIAVYMPGRDYRELSANLLSAGLDADTPCLVISRATLKDERTLVTNIRQLATVDPLAAPTHIIVGRCASPSQMVMEAQRRVEISSSEIQSKFRLESNA